MESNKICFGNLLLFTSQYMLIPVLPVAMADRMDSSLINTGLVFVIITFGMLLVGPLYSYLADTFKRKYVCLLAFFIVLAATAGYKFVSNETELWLLALIQGAALGITTSAGIILAIDISPSSGRSQCNIRFGWAARLGMFLGIILGVLVYSYLTFNAVIYTSIGIGLVGIFSILLVHVPFRAPIGVSVFSFDRFLLRRGLLPAVNMLFIAFIPGLLFPLFYLYSNDVIVHGVAIPFFAWTLAGMIVGAIIIKVFFKGKDTPWKIIAGIALLVISMLRILPHTVVTETLNAILLGLGLGLVTPEFLLIFIRLCKHCQRSTANTTHLLSWEMGCSLGVFTACYLADNDLYTSSVNTISVVSGIVALLFFVTVTYPYYRKKRTR